MDRICRAEPEPAERPASGAARGLGEEGGGGRILEDRSATC
jgi:hypothetical protein